MARRGIGLTPEHQRGIKRNRTERIYRQPVMAPRPVDGRNHCNPGHEGAQYITKFSMVELVGHQFAKLQQELIGYWFKPPRTLWLQAPA